MIQHWLKGAVSISDDPDTQTGAVLVKDGRLIGMGANRLPEGVLPLADRLQRPAKYKYLIHAEPDAICDAAKDGESTRGAEMYLNWFPCAPCAKMIVQAGISRLHCDREAYEARKDDSRYEFAQAMEILTEGGVEIMWIEVLWRKRYEAQPSIPEKTTPSQEALAAMAHLQHNKRAPRWPSMGCECGHTIYDSNVGEEKAVRCELHGYSGAGAARHKTLANPHSGNAGGLRLDSGS